MQIHHYHHETLEYVGSTVARVDPLEHQNHVKSVHAAEKAKAEKAGRKFDPSAHPVEPSHFLVPAYATSVAPPEVPEGKVARFVDGRWQIADVERPALPESVPADPWAGIRMRRNGLLQASDWTQIADAPLTKAKKAEWAKYRAVLRDLPASSFNPDKIDWPTPPVKG